MEIIDKRRLNAWTRRDNFSVDYVCALVPYRPEARWQICSSMMTKSCDAMPFEKSMSIFGDASISYSGRNLIVHPNMTEGRMKRREEIRPLDNHPTRFGCVHTSSSAMARKSQSVVIGGTTLLRSMRANIGLQPPEGRQTAMALTQSGLNSTKM